MGWDESNEDEAEGNVELTNLNLLNFKLALDRHFAGVDKLSPDIFSPVMMCLTLHQKHPESTKMIPKDILEKIKLKINIDDEQALTRGWCAVGD